MTEGPVNYFPLLLLLLGYPIGRGVEIFAERLLLKPYPRDAWGSWLLVGWAVGLFVVMVQFVLGTFAYEDRLQTNFLSRGLPTILYAAILLSLINRMFPEFAGASKPNFLLANFQENYRYYYGCGFLLALNPFILGFYAFDDALISLPQISRIVWMVIFAAGVLVPKNISRHIVFHKVVWAIAFPLIMSMFVAFSSRNP